MSSSPPIAKITRPAVSGICHRERLFKLLDDAGQKPVTWIVAPAGSGKTTLVASWLDSRKLPCLWYRVDEGDGDVATFFYYMGMASKKASPRFKKSLPLLTPEYLQGIPTFTRRYCESLFARLTGGSGLKPAPASTKFILVLDNYQDATGPAFQEVIANFLNVIPDSINVVVVSRVEPPTFLLRLKANNKMSIIGWNEVRFSLDEAGELLRMKSGEALPADKLRLLQDKTDGWAAGLVLMTEATHGSGFQSGFHTNTNQDVFDYFANEIFARTDKDVQQFLLKTSFLPAMTARMAEKLTGVSQSHQILSGLSRNNYFTDWRPMPEPAFQYHPLFREFLLKHALDTFSENDLSRIRLKAAILLAESGQIEDAVSLYRESEEWEGLVKLILDHAPSLVTQGRSKTLEDWILGVPKMICQDTPWVIYWLGVCRLAHDPSEARENFEQAYERFVDNGDPNGLFLAWSGIVGSFIYEWDDFRPLDRWIEWLQEQYRKGMPILAPEVDARVAAAMFMALVYRCPHNPDIEFWLERALSLTAAGNDSNLSLQAYSTAANYFFWIGNFDRVIALGSRIGEFDRSPDASPFHKIVWRFIDAANDLCFAPAAGSATAKLDEALHISEKTGIHIWDHMLMALGVYIANLEGDVDVAEDCLARMKPFLSSARRHLSCQYHALAAWCAVLRGNTAEAVTNGEIALKYAEDTGFIFPEILCLLEFANILQTDGRYDESMPYLDKARKLSRETGSSLFLFASLLSRARIYLDTDRERDGLSYLAEALRIGKIKRYLGPPWWWQPSVMAALCARAFENGIETEYAEMLVRKRRLFPERPVENWPYPIKIYAFGRFGIVKDGRPIEFTGKTPKKPIEMLKAIIAMGGREVGEEQLIDTLWPEAEGDAAHSTFKSTLHRLRQLIGNEEVLIIKEGRVTLDPRHCWVDVWVFQRILSEVDRVDEDRAAKAAEKGVSIYHKDFLDNDKGLSWAVSMRERLRAGFIRLVKIAGNNRMKSAQWEESIKLYQKALEVNDLEEEFYRALMLSYSRLGRKSDVQTTYRRCSALLSAVLEVEPSRETKAAYKKAMTDQ